MNTFLSSLFRVLAVLSGVSSFFVGRASSSNLEDAAWLGLIVLAYCFAILGKSFYSKAVRKKMALDSRPPVLFLRSFQEEKDARMALISLSISRFLSAAFWNIEDRVVRTFREYGPVTMLDAPVRWLPGSGANMPKVGHEHWAEEVRLLMENAVLVLIAAGRTPGLLWEMETALTMPDRRKILIVARNGLEYEVVRERLQSALGERCRLRAWPHFPQFNKIYFMYLNDDDEVRAVTPSFWLRIRDRVQASNLALPPRRWTTVGKCVPEFFFRSGLVPPGQDRSGSRQKRVTA